MSDKASSPSWWQNEDWLAVLAAAPLLVAASLGWQPTLPKFSWSAVSELGAQFSGTNLSAMLDTSGVVMLVSVVVLAASLGKKLLSFLCGTAVVLALAWLAQAFAAHAGMKAYGLEYVLFALGLGLLWSHTLPVPQWLSSAVRTEFFIKVGIVLLGAGMLFSDLLKSGTPGMIQAALVIPVVWYATFWIARRLRVDEEFTVMLSTAVSICGVSAAIAACGAIQGDKKKLSYVTSVVLLCAVPMMILMPVAVRALGLSDAVGGAWMGGTLDTSGSVLAATESLSTEASKVGTIVKLSQNVLIGLAAFLISVWWSMRAPGSSAPSGRVIWERFPKFVLGFILASLVFSFLLPADVVKATEKPLKGLREVWFSAAFVCIGLETRLSALGQLGGYRPALAFLGGQCINILWTLLLAYWLFR